MLKIDVVPHGRWSNWQTIALGIYKDVGALRSALTRRRCRVSQDANEMLSKAGFELSRPKSEVDLVFYSVITLGFKTLTRYRDICAAAGQRGLQLCPGEIGPYLRLQLEKQFHAVLVAMDPIIDAEGVPLIFSLRRNQVRRFLEADVCDPDSLWSPSDCFVFMHPERRQR